jgi:hypothetical protein
MSAVGPSDTRCHGSGGFAIQTPRDQGLQAAHYSAAHIMNASAAAAEQPVSYNKNAASSSGAVWNKRMSDLCTSVQVLDAFVHQQPRETQQDSRETAEVDHNIAIGRTLLVRNIAADVPVTSAASDSEQYGEYENEDSLKKCFLPFGSVVTVTVRHRIQKVESGELKNTSWALVTMALHSEAEKILEAAASGRVTAGINELHIELLNEAKAIRSSGQMAWIWGRRRVTHQLQRTASEMLTSTDTKQPSKSSVDALPPTADTGVVSRYGNYAYIEIDTMFQGSIDSIWKLLRLGPPRDGVQRCRQIAARCRDCLGRRGHYHRAFDGGSSADASGASTAL